MKVPPILEAVDGQRVDGRLAPLLQAVYAEVQRPAANLRLLREELDHLLRFLASPSGRTHANCVAADSFFMENDRWERDWEHLPEGFQDVLGMMGDALHDTVSTPEIAENFDNTPEQLLDRVQQLEIPERTV